MATPWSKTYRAEGHTFRKFRDGDHDWPDFESRIFDADHSHKCPTYVHRTPPCQGSCPAGEDIRGWLQVVRGLEKPPEGMSWQEYAFRRATDANPFPSQMGRVCPGTVRGRLQPQRGGGLRRDQRRGAVHRRHRHRGRLCVRAACARHRKACGDHRRRAGRTHRRVPAPPAAATGARSTTTTRRSVA